MKTSLLAKLYKTVFYGFHCVFYKNCNDTEAMVIATVSNGNCFRFVTKQLRIKDFTHGVFKLFFLIDQVDYIEWNSVRLLFMCLGIVKFNKVDYNLILGC